MTLPRKFAGFADDYHRPDSCLEWCKVHWYWDFQSQSRVPYPQEAYWRQDNGWARMVVYCGPPAYYPKKPDPGQQVAMHRMCPHEQMMLTCNHCLRHMFHPYTREELQ